MSPEKLLYNMAVATLMKEAEEQSSPWYRHPINAFKNYLKTPPTPPTVVPKAEVSLPEETSNSVGGLVGLYNKYINNPIAEQIKSSPQPMPPQ